MPIYTKTCRFKPFPLVGIRARYVSDRRTGILQPRWSDKRYAMSRIAFFFCIFFCLFLFLFFLQLKVDRLDAFDSATGRNRPMAPRRQGLPHPLHQHRCHHVLQAASRSERNAAHGVEEKKNEGV